MSIGKRFKRGMAAFLKDELLEIAKYSSPIGISTVPAMVINQVEFDTLQMQEIIDLSEINRMQKPYGLEGAIEDAKRRLSKEVLTHVHVNSEPLLDSRYSNAIRLVLTLRIQKKR
ncbi:MAG: hypothetical protein KAU20_06875 [Nanoarchaeota archaeon]|nr:hypothetical protein [Nanoarchaeota archaeon]